MTEPIIINKRIQSIDLLRGLVMTTMALDHSRDFIHYGNSINQDPLDFATTTPILFMTRWITHFCAPVFVFLSGTSIFLYSSKGKTKKQVAFFLFTRGLFLMFAQIFIMAPLWDASLSLINLQVIWAIGLCMVILSVLQFLPYKLLFVLGLIIIFSHNLLDSIAIDTPFWKSFLWAVVHQEHEFKINNNLLVIVAYPFLPWLGLMISGYCIGKLYLPETDVKSRKKLLQTFGILSILLFALIRYLHIYGDLNPWQHQPSLLYTFFDFIDNTKYPPSLLYILMTIGPALIVLPYLENISHRGIWKKIIVFGRVPFFYYVLHVALIHSIAFLILFASGHSLNELDFHREGALPYGSGHALWLVYIVWIVAIFILYFPCRWYSNYKATHKHWWLSYI